jgi:hypothetical protein
MLAGKAPESYRNESAAILLRRSSPEGKIAVDQDRLEANS